MPAKRNNRATEAAKKAMRLRGHVVIGLRPDSALVHKGMLLREFGGQNLSGPYYIKITGNAKRKDWEAQRKALFPGKPDSKHLDGSQYFKCQLIEFVEAK